MASGDFYVAKTTPTFYLKTASCPPVSLTSLTMKMPFRNGFLC
jgi:hypothetical protein